MSDTSGGPVWDEVPMTAEDVLKRYSAGETFFEGADLPDGSSFHGAALRGIHFKNAWLFDADFSHADLRGAIFENSNVKCVNFQPPPRLAPVDAVVFDAYGTLFDVNSAAA